MLLQNSHDVSAGSHCETFQTHFCRRNPFECLITIVFIKIAGFKQVKFGGDGEYFPNRILYLEIVSRA
jgi:hypothetical protein